VAVATREAERDRAALLQDQGDDANNSEQKIELIHKRDA
jgi:(E)-4-hydroxy-3-methylbut-2-enyl-diphosphate synthase